MTRQLLWLALAIGLALQWILLRVSGVHPGPYLEALADRVLILEDGTQLWIPQDQSLETLKEGAIVKAVYEEKDGKKVEKVVTSFKVSG